MFNCVCNSMASICYDNNVRTYLTSNTVTPFYFLLFSVPAANYFSVNFSHVYSQDIASLMATMCFSTYVIEGYK